MSKQIIKTESLCLSIDYLREELALSYIVEPNRAIFEIKPRKNKWQVFISYSSVNKKFANEVRKKIENNGIKVWMDEKLLGGDNWRKEIETALKASDIVLILLDKNSVQSHYITYEWAFALGHKGEKMIIPLVREDCEMHKRIDSNGVLQHIDFRKRCKWKDLITTIKLKLDQS
jgi:hypothetical protein